MSSKDITTEELSRARAGFGRAVSGREAPVRSGPGAGEMLKILQGLCDNISDLVFLCDSDSNILYVNRAFERLTGYRTGEFIGRSFSLLYDGENLEKAMSYYRRTLAGEPSEYSLSFKQTGAVCEYKALPYRDELGAVRGVIGIARDVTERVRSEQRLTAQAEHMKDVQRLARLGSWQWDIVRDRTVWSDELFGLLAMEPREFDEKLYEEFLGRIHYDDRDRVEKVFSKAFDEKKPFRVDYRIVHPDGAVLAVSSSADVLKDPSGRPVAMVGFTQDMTRRAAREAENLKKEKLDSLGVLAGGIAHDFNNLLTAILGNISVTKHSVDLADTVYVKLQEAESATMRARELTQQLLTFSRGGAPVKETIAVGDFLNDSVVNALRRASLKCEFSIPEGLPSIEADEGQLGQVINNIVRNAEQAMPDGGVIRVIAEEQVVENHEDALLGAGGSGPLGPGRYVRITVADHGTGIPEELLGKVFDPYFTTKDKASGLGLAVAYSIVKNHGGQIGIESRAGAGTAVHIYLPASEGVAAPGRAGKGVYTSGKGRVLIMDDEEIIRELAGEFLLSLGYDVECAKDGEEAIALYSTGRKTGKPFEVVIMDLTVPGGMGGKEATRKILELDPEARVIVSSGYCNDPVMSDYAKYGFVAMIAKPYKITELNGVVQRVLNTRPA